MYNTKTLAMTGPGLAIGGYVLDQSILILAAVILMIVGALLVRMSFRKGKSAGEA